MSPETLLKGAVYALEQCGLLLRDANILYRNRSYASAVVLTAFAREELGRYRILLEFWHRARDGKETFTADQIRNACDNHVTKQQAGMFSSTMRTDRDSGLGKVLRASMENPPQSSEFKEARAALKKIDETKLKRTPNDRHEKRMTALYVEPKSETGWNRPADQSSALDAHNFLQDAVNEYSLQYGQRYNLSEILKQDDPDLFSAIAQWSDRPELPAPEHPLYPGLEQVDGEERSMGGVCGLLVGSSSPEMRWLEECCRG
jgi:AbiV family abortive infection protein